MALQPPALGLYLGPSLTFLFEGLSLVVAQETSGFNGFASYVRSEIIEQQAGIRYNFQGKPIVDGQRTEAGHAFAFDLLLDEVQFFTFKAIVKRSQARFKAKTGGPILLYDNRVAFQEESPRTRAIVPATTENTTLVPGESIYFAQFSIQIPQTPELEESLRGNIIRETAVPGTFERRTMHNVVFTATELEKVPA